MKRYKFKIGQEVYIDGANNRRCIIRKRKLINKTPHYLISIADCWDNGWKFNKKIFDVGFRNHPRQDNYLQEDLISEEYYNFYCDVPECGNNGCEVIQNLLDDDSLVKDEESQKIIDDINFYNSCIDGCKSRIDGYETAIWGLKKLIEEEKDASKKYMNKIAILTNDDGLYRGTFIYTIQD